MEEYGWVEQYHGQGTVKSCDLITVKYSDSVVANCCETNAILANNSLWTQSNFFNSVSNDLRECVKQTTLKTSLGFQTCLYILVPDCKYGIKSFWVYSPNTVARWDLMMCITAAITSTITEVSLADGEGPESGNPDKYPRIPDLAPECSLPWFW